MEENKKNVNQTQPANSGTVNEKPSDGKTNYSDMSIKELFAKLEMRKQSGVMSQCRR